MIKKWSVSYPAVNGTEQRRVYVYLPTMYEAEPDRRFPVLYMFDGQNVFFDEDATYGKSWGVADYLDYTDTPLIVAAVECNAGPNNERLVEYSPYRFDDPTYGHFDGKGQATMSWYIHRFKPFIDRSFRTLSDREHTFIGGSSMGGLMSLYALLQYNDTFSRAAALSPSIWVAPDKLAGLVGRAKRCTWITAPARWATTTACAAALRRCAARCAPAASTSPAASCPAAPTAKPAGKSSCPSCSIR